jgi:hypothetical protein
VPELTAALAAAHERISRWRITAGWKAIAKGFAACHRKAGRAYRDACRHPDARHRHAWRKRAKDLLHQVALLRRLWPGPMRAWERAWRQLADRLGQEHDLHVLIGRLRASPGGPAGTRQLTRLAKDWAASLRRRTMLLGERLHAERTTALMERLRRYARSAGLA